MKKYCFLLGILLNTMILTAGSGEKIRLLIRADDIGSSHAANAACIEAYDEGIARSVEVMVPCAWFLEAAAMLQARPDYDVGVHITLTSEWQGIKWRPLTHAPTLVDSNGYFHPRQKNWSDPAALNAFWNPKTDIKEVEQEVRAQIEMAMAHIPQVSHLSGHMGIFSVSDEMKALKRRLEKDYGLVIDPAVTVLSGEWNSSSTDSFVDREAALIKMIESLTPGTYRIVEHPGKDTPEMQAIGHPGYEHVADHRDAVTRSFVSDAVKRLIEERGIELISYKDLKLP